MSLTRRQTVRCAAAERPLRPSRPPADAAYAAMGEVFARLAARLPVPTPYSRPPRLLLATTPDELADQLEAEEADPYGRAVGLAALAEEIGDPVLRQLAGRAGAILRRRRAVS